MEENVFYKPGEPSSVMSLNEEVDLFASCVNIYTTETDVYGDIMDEPRELEVFDEGAWALNLATGIVATLGLAACAIAVVATGGAALAVVAFASAAVGTGVMTAGMSYADKKNQKNRSNLEYGIGLMLGAAVGALTGVGIMYAGPALTVAGEQAGFEASFLMGTNALTVSTIPDIVTAGGMTLLATDGAYVLNEINTMCTGQNLAVDTVFEGNEENYEACVVALQVLNDGLLDLTTRGYQRNGSGSSSSKAGKSDEGAEISESGVNIRGAGDESGSSSNKFSNWDDMKDAYKGKVTKFLKGNKPKGSPIPKNWFEKGGTLEIETLDDGSQIWKYTSAKGDTVPYINQQVKFPKQYMFPDEDIAEFSIGKFTGDRELDKKAALEFLRSEGYDEIPDGYVLHHDYENGKMQLIEEEIHRIFTHYGGNYYNK